MKKFSKALSLTLATMLSLSMVACGGGNSNDLTGGDGLVLKEQANATKQVVFEYLQAGFGNNPYIAVANAYMEKNPDVQVVLVPNREIVSTTATALATNTGISDIYSYPYGDVLKTWYTNGWLEDLTGLCNEQTQDGRTMLESMTGNASKAINIKDKIYAVPEYTSLTGFVYNVEVFENYGWKIPTTTKELGDLCEQILKDTNGKMAPINWCSDADGYLYFAAESWISQYEGIANMNKFHEYASPEVYALEDNDAGSIFTAKKLALENLQKFFLPMNEGGYAHNDSRELHNQPAQYNIIDGSCAMMLNGSWFVNEMDMYLKETPAKLGMFAVPEMSDEMGNVLHGDGYTTENGKRVITADYGAYYFIPSASINKAEAKDFLLYLSSEEACAIYTQYSNAVRPFIYDVSESSALYGKMDDFGKSILKMADTHYLYAAVSTNELTLKGKGGLWPRGNRVESEIMASRDGDALTLLTKDYNFAKENWQTWMDLIK